MKLYCRLFTKILFFIPFLPFALNAYPVETIAYHDNDRPQFQLANYYYPPQTLFIYSKHVDGLSIILYDGSEWKIQRSHSREVNDFWWKDNPIVITPSYWPTFSGSKFYITNLINGSWVYAEPIVGPTVGGSYTNRLVNIDYYCGRICLLDGRGLETCWEVDPQDLFLIQDWMMNQCVMLGSADNPMNGWDSYYDIMLLNVERNRTVKARRY